MSPEHRHDRNRRKYINRLAASLPEERNKLLKYHDEVIDRSLLKRQKEYDACNYRLNLYTKGISRRMRKESRESLEQELARSIREREKEQAEIIAKKEKEKRKMEEKAKSEDICLEKAELLMRRSGLVASYADKHLKEQKSTRSSISSDDDTNLTRRFHSDTINAASAKLGVAGAYALSRSLSSSLGASGGLCLKELHLQYNAISDSGLHVILQALEEGGAQNLCNMNLTANQITAQGIRFMQSTLLSGSLPALSVLILKGNPIQNDGARMISHIFLAGMFRSIEILNVASCGISNCGIRALRSALGSERLSTLAPKIQKVVMRDNRCFAQEMVRCRPWPDFVQI